MRAAKTSFSINVSRKTVLTEIAANKGVKREERILKSGGVGGVQDDSPMRDGRVRKQGVGKKFQRSA